MTEAKFCDISNHQPSTKAYIQAIKDWGAKAVVLKVTEGNYFIDPTAQAKKSLVESLGMLCHAYHFSHFTTSAEAKTEAKFFSDRCSALGYDKIKPLWSMTLKLVTCQKIKLHLRDYVTCLVMSCWR